MGSTQILLRSDALQLSKALGTRFSTNGDTFGVINPTREIVNATLGPMITSIARFKNNDTNNNNNMSFSIEDLGIPRMFAEVLPSLFYYMSLHKSSMSFLPKLNLIHIFNETILRKINDLHTKEELFKVNDGLDISSSNTLISKISEIITDLQRITVDEKTRAQSTDERVRNMLMLFGMGVDGNPPTAIWFLMITRILI